MPGEATRPKGQTTEIVFRSARSNSANISNSVIPPTVGALAANSRSAQLGETGTVM